MDHIPTGRAIFIALLLFVAGAGHADDANVAGSVQSSQEAAVISVEKGATITPQAPDVTADQTPDKLEENPNKEKLTIFFSIGLVINIVMMSLFGFWAVRQWRKTGNSRGKQ